MSDIAYELRYLQAAVSELKTYLLSEKLFWNTGVVVYNPGETPYPQLTLGNLIFYRRRVEIQLAGGLIEASAAAEAQRVEHKIETLHQKWRTAWENKAAHEFVSRFRQWRIYVAEIKKNPEKHAIFYSSEVRVRVLLELLKDQLGPEAPEELTLLPQVDARLQALFAPGEFLWEDDLKPGFDPETYWFLYGHPQEEAA